MPNVYVAVILRNPAGKFLSIHCKQKECEKWRFPAGKVEQHEPLLAAAARELKEETGVEALSLVFHSRQSAASCDGDVWTGYYFLCDAYFGTPAVQEPDKHDQLEWFSYNELATLDASKTVLNVMRSLDPIELQPAVWWL